MASSLPPNKFTDVEGSSPDDLAIGARSQSQELAQPAAAYPYETRLNILHGPLEVIDLNDIAASSDHRWFNQTLCKVNESVVRTGIIEGEYHWHQHNNDDEFFFVLDGMLLIDLQSRTIELAPGQGMVVPRGTVHRTRAPQRTIILMVENAGIVPTGDSAQ
jgi:mannose-6-phosphate isomerase-like protein (cupin superfamily)